MLRGTWLWLGVFLIEKKGDDMLKSCQYCGHIHEKQFDCGKKPVRRKRTTDIDRFRWAKAWQEKRNEIRERDNNLCQVCIRNMYGTERICNYTNLSVHHAIPVENDWNKRLDNDNLLTLCNLHHEMAEAGEISYNEIKGIIDDQERRKSIGEYY